MHWIALLIATALNATAHFMMKWGRLHADEIKPIFKVSDFQLDWVFILGGGLFFASLVFYYYALTKISVSVAYPFLVNAALILILVTSTLFLSEKLTVTQYIGIGCLMLGLWFIH